MRNDGHSGKSTEMSPCIRSFPSIHCVLMHDCLFICGSSFYHRLGIGLYVRQGRCGYSVGGIVARNPVTPTQAQSARANMACPILWSGRVNKIHPLHAVFCNRRS